MALFVSAGIRGVDASRALRRWRTDIRLYGQLTWCTSVKSSSCGFRRRPVLGVIGSAVTYGKDM